MDCVTVKVKALQSFETPVTVYEPTWRNMPEDTNPQQIPLWGPHISNCASIFVVKVNTFGKRTDIYGESEDVWEKNGYLGEAGRNDHRGEQA
jgi:hypothetical protein